MNKEWLLYAACALASCQKVHILHAAKTRYHVLLSAGSKGNEQQAKPVRSTCTEHIHGQWALLAE
jgi:hypothetical protein